MSADSDLESLSGSTILGKYRVDSLIGRGGMGAVFQAEHLGIGKRVALKFLNREAARDLDAVSRFQREAEAASAVESAHIVQIFDSGRTEDGLPFLVMELLKGEDLRSRMRREGRLDLATAIHVSGQVLKGLGSAHRSGIVHRDLKPDNVFLCERDDDPLFVKIVDFGISKVARRATVDTLTQRGVVLGTPFYMSPEQAQALRDIDGRADLYSLGAILYEALAGRPPHVGETYESVLISICTKDAEDVRTFARDVPEGLAALIGRALCRDRMLRFPSADAFYDELRELFPELLAKRKRAHVSPGASRPVGASHGDSAERFVPGTSVPTTSGAALPSIVAGQHARRTAVAALVAALFAFGLTAFLMSRRSSDGSAESIARPLRSNTTALSAPAPAAPTPTPQPDPPPEEERRDLSEMDARAPKAGEPPAPLPSASPRAARSVAKSKAPARRVGPETTAIRAAKPLPSSSPSPTATSTAVPAKSSVAGGLKLNTKGP